MDLEISEDVIEIECVSGVTEGKFMKCENQRLELLLLGLEDKLPEIDLHLCDCSASFS